MSTYSFGEVGITMQHPLVGVLSLNGEGMGSITKSFTDNLTESEKGADGSTMVTKVISRRGTLTIEVLQSSYAAKWLTQYNNVLDNAPASSWMAGSLQMIENYDNGLTTTATGLSPVKRPDGKNAQQGALKSFEYFTPNMVEA